MKSLCFHSNLFSLIGGAFMIPSFPGNHFGHHSNIIQLYRPSIPATGAGTSQDQSCIGLQKWVQSQSGNLISKGAKIAKLKIQNYKNEAQRHCPCLTCTKPEFPSSKLGKGKRRMISSFNRHSNLWIVVSEIK